MMYGKNDVQKVEQWIDDTWYIGYEMYSMTRTENGIILRFRGTKQPKCRAIVQQHKIPYIGIGEVKITEYYDGEVMGWMNV